MNSTKVTGMVMQKVQCARRGGVDTRGQGAERTSVEFFHLSPDMRFRRKARKSNPSEGDMQ